MPWRNILSSPPSTSFSPGIGLARTWATITVVSVHYCHLTNSLFIITSTIPPSGKDGFWEEAKHKWECGRCLTVASVHYHYLAQGTHPASRRSRRRSRSKCKQKMKSHLIHWTACLTLVQSHLWRHRIFWNENLDTIVIIAKEFLDVLPFLTEKRDPRVVKEL